MARRTTKKKGAADKAAPPVVQDEAAAAVRKADVLASDDLPDELRTAIRECPFNIVTPRLSRGLDVAEITRRVRAVKTEAEAREINTLIDIQINRRGGRR